VNRPRVDRTDVTGRLRDDEVRIEGGEPVHVEVVHRSLDATHLCVDIGRLTPLVVDDGARERR